MIIAWLRIFIFCLWHRIVSVTSPWIAPQQPPYSQSESFYRTVLDDRLSCIFAACGSETASGRRQRAYIPLIKQYGQAQQDRKSVV